MKQTAIVTRDSQSGHIYIWQDGAELYKNKHGHWGSMDDIVIGSYSARSFKFTFGYTPRKGSRETITITVERGTE